MHSVEQDRRYVSGLQISRMDSRVQRAFHASSVHQAPKDPYQVLGVKKDASQADIKKTYFAVSVIENIFSLLS